MSSSADVAAFIQQFADSVYGNNVTFAATVLLLYDSLLTLPREVKHIWRMNFKLAAILYIMARYGAIIYYLTIVVGNVVPLAVQTCTNIVHFLDSIIFLPVIGVQGLLILRTYAISNQNTWVLSTLCFLLLGSVTARLTGDAVNSCKLSTAHLNLIFLGDNIGTAFTIALDTAVLVITVWYTIGTVKLSQGISALKNSLSAVLLTQGIIRYIFVLTITVSGFVTNAVLRLSVGNIIIPLNNSLSVIIICHFLLDIRERNAHPNGSHTISLPKITSFQAAVQHFHNIVSEEFGDHPDALSQTEDSQGEAELEERQERRLSGIDVNHPGATV